MTKKSLFWTALAQGLALFLASSSAYALLVTVPDAGGNAITIGSAYAGGGNWEVDAIETYDNLNSIWTEFSKEPNQTYDGGSLFFSKEITNNSGELWKDFHMKLYTLDSAGAWVPSPNNDGLYFINVSMRGPFGQVWWDPNEKDEAWLWENTWASGAAYTLEFEVGGWGWNGTPGAPQVMEFRMEQWPTLTGGPVPEPGTLALMGIALAGLGFRRAQRPQ